jgi:hypothetical protein
MNIAITRFAFVAEDFAGQAITGRQLRRSSRPERQRS